jgi:hypothetical protein
MRSWWFPLSLAFLLLVGLTGSVVLILQLFGFSPSLPGLTSSWLLPLWAGIILLLLPALLLLLYFLKLRRKAVAVPSTFLWRKSIEDAHVNSLIRWLRRNVLLLLQLCTLFIFLFALLALQVHEEGEAGQYYVVLIDNSASMSATDVAPSRLERAREEALKLIDSRSESDAGMVIAFNNRAAVLQPFTSDRSLLRRAVQRIEQTQATTRIDEALLQAEGRANPLRSTDDQASRPPGEDPSKARTYVAAEGVRTEVHLFSDGGFEDVPEFALGNLALHYHKIGGKGPVDNVGLVGLSAQRDEKDARVLNVLATVRNFRNQAVKLRVQLEVRIDGVLQGVYDQAPKFEGQLPAHSVSQEKSEIVHFRLHDVRQRTNVVLHAKLLDVKDSFPLDNEAWLVVGVTRKARVLVVRPSPNRVLDSFLGSMEDQGLAAVQVLPDSALDSEADYRQPARDGNWDLVIFDRCAPAREGELPLANTFFIDSLPPPWKRDPKWKVKSPRIRGWAVNHPLMRNLTGLQDVAIADAFLFDLRDPKVPGRPPRLLETDRENALLFTLPRRPYTDLVMTFSLIDGAGRYNTFWPLHLSFPLFLKNVVFQLGNIEGDEPMQPGQIKRLRPEGNVIRLEVLTPAGKSYTLTRGGRADFLFDRLDQVGVYEVRHDGELLRQFAVNLLEARESNLEPRREFQVGSQQVEADTTTLQPRDLWKLLAVLAFVLLLVEWYVYTRRISV